MIPFAQVVIEVNKLYASVTHESQLEERCRTIVALLEACGYTEESYEQLLHQSEGLTIDADDLPYAGTPRAS